MAIPWYEDTVDCFGMVETNSGIGSQRYIPYYPGLFKLDIEDGREWTLKITYHYVNSDTELTICPKVACPGSGLTSCNTLFEFTYPVVKSEYKSGPRQDDDCSGTWAGCYKHGVNENGGMCWYDAFGNVTRCEAFAASCKDRTTSANPYPKFARRIKYYTIPIIPFCTITINLRRYRPKNDGHREAIAAQTRFNGTWPWHYLRDSCIIPKKMPCFTMKFAEGQGKSGCPTITEVKEGCPIITDEYGTTLYDKGDTFVTSKWGKGEYGDIDEMVDEDGDSVKLQLILHDDINNNANNKMLDVILNSCTFCLDVNYMVGGGTSDVAVCDLDVYPDLCTMDTICNGEADNPAKLMNPALQTHCSSYCYHESLKNTCQYSLNHLCKDLTPAYLESDIAHEYEKKYCGCWISEATMDDWFKENFFDNDLLSTDGIENENVGCIYTGCIDSEYKFQGYSDCKSVTYCVNQVNVERDLNIGCEIGDDGTASCGALNLTNNCGGSEGDGTDSSNLYDKLVDLDFAGEYTNYVVIGGGILLFMTILFLMVKIAV